MVVADGERTDSDRTNAAVWAYSHPGRVARTDRKPVGPVAVRRTATVAPAGYLHETRRY